MIKKPTFSSHLSLLCDAPKQSGRIGIGKVMLRDREDTVLIAPRNGSLAPFRLRYPTEVCSMKDVPDVDVKPETDKHQLKLVCSLVDTVATSLSALELKDCYRDTLREIIDAKIRGKEIVTVAEEARPVVDIMTALRRRDIRRA